jgi:peptide/nickel transport system substrate-binding protein
MKLKMPNRAVLWTLAAAVLLVGPLMVLAAAPEVAAQRGAGGTFRAYLWQAPTTLNPHLSSGTKDLTAARIVYEPLATFDAEGTMVPVLAAEAPTLENGGVAPDGRSVTWRLKEGVTWSDGEPFTADDVLFTYEFITNPDVASTSLASYSGIDRIEVVDDLTVTIHFSEVNPAWAIPFVGVLGMIIPRHVFADYTGANAADAPANLAPVGTGPFRVAEYKTEGVLLIGEDAVSTIRIMFEANPLYRDPDKPWFSAIELQGGGGDAVIAAQLVIDDQADYAWNVEIDDATLTSIEQSSDVTLNVDFNAFTERIMINFTDPNREASTGERSSVEFPHPFFTDKLVRQAFAHAVDRDAIVELHGISGKATTNLLVAPPALQSSDTLEMYPFDLERAAALLDEAGWIDTNANGIRDKNGTEMRVVFLTSVNPVRQGAQEIVRVALESIGVAVENKSVDSSVFLGPPAESTNTRVQFYADLEEFAYSNKTPDPTAYLAAWTCDQAAQLENNWSKPNWARYCNPEFDTLYRQVLTETDPDVRIALFMQMNDVLIEDVALIPLVHTSTVAALGSDLAGESITPWDTDLWNIADWRAK